MKWQWELFIQIFGMLGLGLQVWSCELIFRLLELYQKMNYFDNS